MDRILSNCWRKKIKKKNQKNIQTLNDNMMQKMNIFVRKAKLCNSAKQFADYQLMSGHFSGAQHRLFLLCVKVT